MSDKHVGNIELLEGQVVKVVRQNGDETEMFRIGERIDAVFRTDPLLFHKFGNIVFFRSGNLYSLCSPGNQDYQKIIHFNFFFINIARNRHCESCIFIGISCNY